MPLARVHSGAAPPGGASAAGPAVPWQGDTDPTPDVPVAETALHHSFGVVQVDGDFDRVAEVRPWSSVA